MPIYSHACSFLTGPFARGRNTHTPLQQMVEKKLCFSFRRLSFPISVLLPGTEELRGVCSNVWPRRSLVCGTSCPPFVRPEPLGWCQSTNRINLNFSNVVFCGGKWGGEVEEMEGKRAKLFMPNREEIVTL